MAAPKTIARYEVLNRIGRGGMGSLYLARDPNIDRLVAIKLLNADLDHGDVRDRFAREAQAAGALNHPNIVTIFDYGVFDDAPFIVMEYIRGETLDEIIKRGAPLPLAHKIGLVEQLSGGLAYAHEAGVIHRDIKPANLMVDHRGGLKILDFGIARLVDSGLTHRTGYAGTAGYMSPEQIEGHPADRRSDLFSVGVVAYELLTYRRAFQGETPAALVHSVLHTTPTPIWSVAPEVGREVAAIVERALEKTPAARYQDAFALQRDLKKVSAAIGETRSEDAFGRRYHIIRVLGEGGMGRVYLARDSELDRFVAIKVLSGSIDQQRFRLEAKAAARLKHPAIITIYDISEHDGKPFIAMEYVAGENVAQLIRERHVPAVVDRLRLIEQLCEGLAAAHEKGIIHRDIKPSNLIVEDGLRLRILDFGVAKAMDSGAKLHGTLVGSHGYMAPELLAGEAFDHRLDIFAACVVAFELLSYERAYPRGVAQCLTDTTVDSLVHVAPGVGKALDGVLKKGLDRNPDHRFESAEALRLAFARIREGLEQQPENATVKLPGVEALRLELERRAAGRATAKAAVERGRRLLEGRAWAAARRSADEALAVDPGNTAAIRLAAAADAREIPDDVLRAIRGSETTISGVREQPQAFAQEPLTPGPPPTGASAARTVWLVAAIGAFVLIVGGSLIWYQPWRSPPVSPPQIENRTPAPPPPASDAPAPVVPIPSTPAAGKLPGNDAPPLTLKRAEAQQLKKDQLQLSDVLSSKGDYAGALSAVKKALENPLLATDPALTSKRDALQRLVKRSGGGHRWSRS